MIRWTSATAVALVWGLLLSAGCSSDDDDPAAVQPALGPEDCPSAPESLQLLPIAPFWGGFVVITAGVSQGYVDQLEAEYLDPASNTWISAYAEQRETPDGRFWVSVSPSVNAGNKDKSFRIRLRSRLDGCAPSSWTETESFSLGDPIAGTTWQSQWPPTIMNGSVVLSRNVAGAADQFEYQFVNGVTHTAQFEADGTFKERYQFELTTPTEGAPFNGCSLSLNYVGNWQITFGRYESSVQISARAPASEASEGSTCTSPLPETWDLVRSEAAVPLNAISLPLSFDLTEFLYAEDPVMRWDATNLSGNFSGALSHLRYESGEEFGIFTSWPYVASARYVKQ